MRRLLLATALCLLPGLGSADPMDLSREIGAKGIAATEARLAKLSAPPAEALFALAALRFLGTVEQALQLRWQTGMAADWSELPILRLPIPENPAARDLKGADITALLDGVTEGMEAARAALTQLGAADFGLQIDLTDLWFDINANGHRDAGEDVADVAGLALGLRGVGTADQAVVIRFDGSDAAWLSAYTNLISGVARLAQAYDPAPAVDGVLDSSKAIYALWGKTPPRNAWDMMFGKEVDRVTMILNALAQAPDPALTQSALQHFQAVIDENRRFWAFVEAETDNDHEWVPSEAQQSGLGLTLPPGTTQHWQAVLAEGELLLQGQLLMPHWRYGAEAGINLKRLFEAPPRVDLVGMVQGAALLPYAEKGPQMTAQAWQDFERLLGGDAMLFAVFFN